LDNLNKNIALATILILIYVAWLFSTTWYFLLRTVDDVEKQRPIWMKIKLAFLSAIVTVLCISNVIAIPYWEYEEESTLLRGQMVELDVLDDEAIRLTFLLENVGSTWVVVNFGDPYEVTIEYGDGEGTTAEAGGGDRCGTGPGPDRFLRLNAGEARILAACVTSQGFRRFVTGPNFLAIDRGGGVVRLVARHSGAVTFSVVLEVMNEGGTLHGLEVPL